MLCVACAASKRAKNSSSDANADNKNLSTQITETPKKSTTEKVLIGTAITAGVVALPFVALPLAGFTSSGVVAGSLAATWQSTIGGSVAAGSLFATCQSVGAVGISTGSVAAAIGTTAAGATKFFGKAATTALAAGSSASVGQGKEVLEKGIGLTKYFKANKDAENDLVHARKMDENPFPENEVPDIDWPADEEIKTEKTKLEKPLTFDEMNTKLLLEKGFFVCAVCSQVIKMTSN